MLGSCRQRTSSCTSQSLHIGSTSLLLSRFRFHAWFLSCDGMCCLHSANSSRYALDSSHFLRQKASVESEEIRGLKDSFK